MNAEHNNNIKLLNIQSDSKLLSGIPWPINGNPDNNLESLCTSGRYGKTKMFGNESNKEKSH
jgi:hypothetical protein